MTLVALQPQCGFMSIRQASPSCPQRLKFAGEAKLLPAGADLVLELHYRPILGTIRSSAETVAVVNRTEALR
jgi:hypothetical protein